MQCLRRTDSAPHYEGKCHELKEAESGDSIRYGENVVVFNP